MSRTRLSTYTAPPAEVTRTLDALRAHYEVPTAFPPEALAEIPGSRPGGPGASRSGGTRLGPRSAPPDSTPRRNARPRPSCRRFCHTHPRRARWPTTARAIGHRRHRTV